MSFPILAVSVLRVPKKSPERHRDSSATNEVYFTETTGANTRALAHVDFDLDLDHLARREFSQYPISPVVIEMSFKSQKQPRISRISRRYAATNFTNYTKICSHEFHELHEDMQPRITRITRRYAATNYTNFTKICSHELHGFHGFYEGTTKERCLWRNAAHDSLRSCIIVGCQ
jgi:hypothetical protein